MQSADIDLRLRHYRDVERQWADNLYDLDEHPTYRLLAAGEMSGKTGAETNEIMADPLDALADSLTELATSRVDSGDGSLGLKDAVKQVEEAILF